MFSCTIPSTFAMTFPIQKYICAFSLLIKFLYKVHRSQGKPLQDIKLLIPVKDNSQRTYRAQTDVLEFICNNKFESIWHLSIIAVLTSIEYLQEM